MDIPSGKPRPKKVQGDDKPRKITRADVDNLVAWFKKQSWFKASQQPNYTVGLLSDGDLIISKVGGVTTKTGSMGSLKAEITGSEWYDPETTRVYLAKKFGAGGTSNHAEMCVVATADALGKELWYVKCTGDNCGACSMSLAEFGVTSGDKAASDTQTGWADPRDPLALGTSLNSDWAGQLEELEAYRRTPRRDKPDFRFRLIQPQTQRPKGKYQRLL